MSTASTVSSRFAVQGMTCGHCEGRVIKSLCAIAGVQSVTASAKDAAAEVAHDGRVSRKTLADAIVAAGYEVSDAVPDDGIRPGTAQVVVPESQVELNAAADGAMADPIAGAHVETIWHSGRLSVGGMHCASCVSAIDQVIAAMEGVDAVSVDLILHAAHVRFDSTKTDLGKIAAQVSALGYPAVPAQADDDPLSTEEVKETSWVAIAFALAMGVLTMVLSMPLMDDHHDPLAHTFMVLDQWLAAVWPSLYHWPPSLDALDLGLGGAAGAAGASAADSSAGMGIYAPLVAGHECACGAGDRRGFLLFLGGHDHSRSIYQTRCCAAYLV